MQNQIPPSGQSKAISIDDALAVLNAALALDGTAVRGLFHHRVPCNDALAEHHTVQVASGPCAADARFSQSELAEGQHNVGVLGLINGIFGVDHESVGFIAAEYEDDGSISRFVRTPTT
jgi:hypothetical protein